ncbi:MAG: DUF4595 domain-containing protein [Muribaculaceae bacterium]|nr:DUF4595 domain-containing protein [Muribaculaceae bacterium]
MNKFKLLMGAFVLALTIPMVSCSDDKDEPEPNPNPNPGDETVVNPKNVFSQGVPSQVGNLVITTNAESLVTKIVDDDKVTTFNYTGAPKAKSRGSVNIPTDYDMTMNVEWGNDEDGVDFYIKLNKQGFIEYAYEVDEDKYDGIQTDEWWFKYNDLGQMIEMKRSEGDNEVTTITYDANGDITTVKVTDDVDGEKEITTIKYTDAANATPIVNKSGIMLYDYSLRIDMDEMAPAYFAGLLGKGTAHLPLSAVSTHTNKENGTSQIFVSNYTFTWELNDSNMPIKFTSVDKYKYPWMDEEIEETSVIELKW